MNKLNLKKVSSGFKVISNKYRVNSLISRLTENLKQIRQNFALLKRNTQSLMNLFWQLCSVFSLYILINEVIFICDSNWTQGIVDARRWSRNGHQNVEEWRTGVLLISCLELFEHNISSWRFWFKCFEFQEQFK